MPKVSTGGSQSGHAFWRPQAHGWRGAMQAQGQPRLRRLPVGRRHRGPCQLSAAIAATSVLQVGQASAWSPCDGYTCLKDGVQAVPECCTQSSMPLGEAAVHCCLLAWLLLARGMQLVLCVPPPRGTQQLLVTLQTSRVSSNPAAGAGSIRVRLPSGAGSKVTASAALASPSRHTAAAAAAETEGAAGLAFPTLFQPSDVALATMRGAIPPCPLSCRPQVPCGELPRPGHVKCETKMLPRQAR